MSSTMVDILSSEEEQHREQEQVPQPTQLEIMRCQFHSWYSVPQLRQVSLKSKVLDLSPAFLEYLASDGVMLPPCAESSTPRTVFQPLGDNDEISDLDYHITGEGVTWEPNSTTNIPDFPVLHSQITAALSELGGEVFIKTNFERFLEWVIFRVATF